MCEFDEVNYNDTMESDKITGSEGEPMDEFEEDNEANGNYNVELLRQQGYDEAYAEDVGISNQEDVSFDLGNASDDELYNKYERVRALDIALGEQYVKYDEQIGQISSDKPYYSEKEWNNYMNEKIKAQDEVSARRYQIQSAMRAIEKEIDRRKG